MSEPVSVAEIVLAAGASSRLGQPKQLLELGGEPLVRHTVRNALASKANAVIVVLGNQAEEIERAIGSLGQRTIVNERFAEGQSTSLVAGLSSIDQNTDAVIFMLGDQPTVDRAILDGLIERFEKSRASIVQPHYLDGKPGNPVLISRELFAELMQVTGDVGARDVVRAHRAEVERFDVQSPHPPDVDTQADYEALIALWQQANASL